LFRVCIRLNNCCHPIATPSIAQGSAASLLVFSFYVFNFLATSTAPLVARRRAAGDELGASLVGGQALSLAIVLGTSLSLILLIYRAPLLHAMGTSVTGPQADAYAEQFLVVRALAAPAVLLCSASNGVMRGYLDTRTPTLILLGSNLVNLALDVFLVANMGMGPRGAGIATTVAEWIAALCFLGVLSGKLPTASGGDDWKKSIIRRSDALDNQKDKYNGGEVLLTVTPLLELPTWEDIRPLVAASSAVFLRSIVLQVAMSSAAAMAARSTPIDGMIAITSGASASVAAHQVALQLWLLCSFLCDALATASQALVADGKGRNDVDAVRTVSQTVFNWGLALGLTLSTCLWVGTASGFLIDFFTSDDVTRIELGKLLTIVILAQPLNSFVFAADGVLQGAGEFTYQAKSMALSVISAFAMFAVLEYTSYGREILTGNDSDTLVHVWYALIILQAVRGITSLVKVVEPMGPIDLFGKKVPT
jgi:Na+-driven multidrug efflux pump